MSQFKYVAHLRIPIHTIKDVIAFLRTKGLAIGRDFNFKLGEVAEHDAFGTPLSNHIKFYFKEGRWATYLSITYE